MRAFFVFIFTLTALIARNLPQETENLSPKIVAVDWTAAEILRSIGYDVAAIGDKRNYEIWVKEPSVENAVDLGLRMQPNLEALIKLKPDFIIIPSFFEFNKNALAQYARVEVIDAYKEGDLYENILDATHRIAKIAKREKEAQNLIRENEEFFKNLRAELARFSNEPIATIQFIDSKHLRIYGENSIYGVSLKKMGLKNASPKEFTFNLWGIATVPITSLFKLPKNSRLVIVEPNPLDIKRELKFNGLFRALGFFENSIQTSPIWSAGAILSMRRFATQLAQNLNQDPRK